MRSSRQRFLVGLACCWSLLANHPTTAHGDFIINQETAGAQTSWGALPLADGSFLGVYGDWSPPSPYQAYIRHFGPTGVALADAVPLRGTMADGFTFDESDRLGLMILGGQRLAVFYQTYDAGHWTPRVSVRSAPYSNVDADRVLVEGNAAAYAFRIHSTRDGFALTWNERETPEYPKGRKLAQCFDGLGLFPSGPIFQVLAYRSSYINSVDLANGSLVLAWQDQVGDDSEGETWNFNQMFKIMDCSGNELFPPTQANVLPTGDTYVVGSHVDHAAGGGFVYTWFDGNDSGPFGDDRQLARFYDDSGVPLGEPQVVGQHSRGFQGLARSAANLAETLIVWQSNGQDGGTFPRPGTRRTAGVYGRRYDASGSPLGPEFRINTWVDGHQEGIGVDALASGDWLVTWSSKSSNVSTFFGGDPSEDGSNSGAIGTILNTGAAECRDQPRTDCVEAERTSLALAKLRAGTGASLGWRFLSQPYAVVGAFGVPSAGFTHYRVCAYDESTSPLRAAVDFPAGNGACGSRPCWSERGGRYRSFRYSAASESPARRQLDLADLPSGRRKISLTVWGNDLALPPVDGLAGDVTIQLVNANDTCWSATHPSRRSAQGAPETHSR